MSQSPSNPELDTPKRMAKALVAAAMDTALSLGREILAEGLVAHSDPHAPPSDPPLVTEKEEDSRLIEEDNHLIEVDGCPPTEIHSACPKQESEAGLKASHEEDAADEPAEVASRLPPSAHLEASTKLQRAEKALARVAAELAAEQLKCHTFQEVVNTLIAERDAALHERDYATQRRKAAELALDAAEKGRDVAEQQRDEAEMQLEAEMEGRSEAEMQRDEAEVAREAALQGRDDLVAWFSEAHGGASPGIGAVSVSDVEKVDQASEAADTIVASEEAELAAALMEAAVASESVASDGHGSPDEEGQVQWLRQQLGEAQAQLHAMVEMQRASDEMSEMQREMIEALEVQLNDRDRENTEGGSTLDVQDSGTGEHSCVASSAEQLMSSSRGLRSWADEARAGRMAAADVRPSASHLTTLAHDPPDLSDSQAEAAEQKKGSLQDAPTGGSRLERSLGLLTHGLRPSKLNAVHTRPAQGSAAGATRTIKALRSGAPDWALAGKAPPPGAVLRLARTINKDAPTSRAAAAAQAQQAGMVESVQGIGGPRAFGATPASHGSKLRVGSLSAHQLPAIAGPIGVPVPLPAGEENTPQNDKYVSAYPPVGAQSVVGKAGMANHGKERKGTALKGRQPRAAARSAPLEERAPSQQKRVSLGPPIGASPGELRLWKMQNGIGV